MSVKKAREAGFKLNLHQENRLTRTTEWPQPPIDHHAKSPNR